MTRSTLSPVRRFSAALAIAGVAGLGTVITAPAALAAESAQDGPAVVQDGPNEAGPDAFIVMEDGRRIPVFFCDPEKPNQRHNNCIPNPEHGPRF